MRVTWFEVPQFRSGNRPGPTVSVQAVLQPGGLIRFIYRSTERLDESLGLGTMIGVQRHGVNDEAQRVRGDAAQTHTQLRRGADGVSGLSCSSEWC